MATNHNNWGGRRRGAGTPRRRFLLDRETARSLHILVKHRRALFEKPELTAEDVISSLVEAEWRTLDEHYQEAAEQVAEAEEPYII